MDPSQIGECDQASDSTRCLPNQVRTISLADSRQLVAGCRTSVSFDNRQCIGVVSLNTCYVFIHRPLLPIRLLIDIDTASSPID